VRKEEKKKRMKTGEKEGERRKKRERRKQAGKKRERARKNGRMHRLAEPFKRRTDNRGNVLVKLREDSSLKRFAFYVKYEITSSHLFDV